MTGLSPTARSELGGEMLAISIASSGDPAVLRILDMSGVRTTHVPGRCPASRAERLGFAGVSMADAFHLLHATVGRK
jgi:hypothetical protein